MRQICLTGATGVLGSALLKAMPPSKECIWHIILRAESPFQLSKRVRNFVERHAFNSKFCHFYAGDVTLPNFGLDANAWTSIVKSCTHYVHAAGKVKLNLTLDDALNVAVNSANTILKLYLQGKAYGKAQKLMFVSTVGVAGRTPGLIQEAVLPDNYGFHNTYEAAKHKAENLIVAANDPTILIIRPSMIVGNQHTGEVSDFQIFYHLTDFFAGLKTDGLLPELNELQLDIIPVDVVADSLCKLMLTSDPFSFKILHLASGPSKSPFALRLVTAVRSFYSQEAIDLPAIKFIPLSEYVTKLPHLSLRLAEHREFHIGLHYILPYLADKQTFANGNLNSISEITVPNYDGYLDTLLRYYIRSQNRRGQPSKQKAS